jgi:hypothetical protein
MAEGQKAKVRYTELGEIHTSGNNETDYKSLYVRAVQALSRDWTSSVGEQNFTDGAIVQSETDDNTNSEKDGETTQKRMRRRKRTTFPNAV